MPTGYSDSGYSCKIHRKRDVSLVVWCQQAIPADKGEEGRRGCGATELAQTAHLTHSYPSDRLPAIGRENLIRWQLDQGHYPAVLTPEESISARNGRKHLA